MKVIDVFNKVARGEKVKDFTIDDGDRVFGVYEGTIIDKGNNKIINININDAFLNLEVHFRDNVKKVDESDLVLKYIIDLLK